jgi:hypothetical protein
MVWCYIGINRILFKKWYWGIVNTSLVFIVYWYYLHNFF